LVLGYVASFREEGKKLLAFTFIFGLKENIAVLNGSAFSDDF
jgi:hypothetical protein